MANYPKMYYAVCDNASEALECLLEGRIDEAKTLLQAGLEEAEDIYIRTCEDEEASAEKLPDSSLPPAMEDGDMAERKVIFSRRFPMLDETLTAQEKKNSLPPDQKRSPFLEALFRRLDQPPPPPIPEKQKKCEQFIVMAKALCEAYEIDMDAFEYWGSVNANIHLHTSYYPGPMIRELAELIILGDDCTISVPGGQCEYITLTPTIYTYR